MAVAAASDLRFAMDDLIADFRLAKPGIEVNVSYGSSGNFLAQIRNRAPFDIYFSADVAYPRELQRDGLVREGSLFLYAVGQIVVWAPKTSALDIENRGIDVLGDPGIRHIAIANPMHAPYGQAAEAALRSLGLYEKVEGKLVLGENVAQIDQAAGGPSGHQRPHPADHEAAKRLEVARQIVELRLRFARLRARSSTGRLRLCKGPR